MGLRERKKLRTRSAIREATYRLIAEQGYDATTVTQIAAAADVSPSTVVRYFPAKEDIVVGDPYGPSLEADLRARPDGEPLTDSLRHVIAGAVRRRLTDDPEDFRLCTRLQAEVPAVRDRTARSLSAAGRLLCPVIAERTGRDAAGLEVRAYAMALVGALMETTLYWAERGHRDDLPALVDRTLDTFAHGL